jgi:hypothetical protein
MSSKIEGAMSLPPAAVAAISLAGVSLQDWVLGATLIWIATQFTWFMWNRWKDFRGRKSDD